MREYCVLYLSYHSWGYIPLRHDYPLQRGFGLPVCKIDSSLWMCSAVLAHIMLNERLNLFGILGCTLCITGSMTIVLHAPEEREISSLLQVWQMALHPGDPLPPPPPGAHGGVLSLYQSYSLAPLQPLFRYWRQAFHEVGDYNLIMVTVPSLEIL